MSQADRSVITFDKLVPREKAFQHFGACWDYLFSEGFLRIFVTLENSVCKIHRNDHSRPYIIHDWLKRDRGIALDYLENLIYPKGEWHDYDRTTAKWREILLRAGDLSPVLFGEPYPNPEPQGSPIFMKELILHRGAMMAARVQQWIYPFPGGYIDLTIDDGWLFLRFALDSLCEKFDLVQPLIASMNIDAGTAQRMRITHGSESGYEQPLGCIAELVRRRPRSEFPHEACRAYWSNLLVQAGDLRPLLIPPESLN